MATVQGQCAATGLPLVAAVLAEGLFYAGVAALWLLIIQWDLLDRLLGGPDLNGPQTVPDVAEIAVLAANARQVLEESTEPVDAADTEAPAAAEAAAVEPPPLKPPSAKDSLRKQLRRRSDRSQDSEPGAPGVSEIPPAANRAHRSLHQFVPWGLPRPDEAVRRYVSRQAEHLSSRLLPELGTHLGIEAGLAGLAAAVPGGIRDCGVRAVDRLESLLRRWAAFGGAVLVLYRILLGRTTWPFPAVC